MEWLDQRHIEDLDPRAERSLRLAGQYFHHDQAAESCLAEAAKLSPDHPAVLLAHYRFYLYKHRFPEAEVFARRCLAQVVDELGLPSVLLATERAHADFTAQEPRIRFWLYGVQALSYVVLRCGRQAEAQALLRKIVELDPSDQTKSRVLLELIEGGPCGE
jgi:tetratricopeptide (TPR) repeat protein